MLRPPSEPFARSLLCKVEGPVGRRMTFRDVSAAWIEYSKRLYILLHRLSESREWTCEASQAVWGGCIAPGRARRDISSYDLTFMCVVGQPCTGLPSAADKLPSLYSSTSLIPVLRATAGATMNTGQLHPGQAAGPPTGAPAHLHTGTAGGPAVSGMEHPAAPRAPGAGGVGVGGAGGYSKGPSSSLGLIALALTIFLVGAARCQLSLAAEMDYGSHAASLLPLALRAATPLAAYAHLLPCHIMPA